MLDIQRMENITYLMEVIMENKVVLKGETYMEITDLLAEKVREAKPEDKERAKRIYLNWSDFLYSLKADGSLFGLVSQ